MKYPNGSCYLLDTRSVLQLLTSDTLDDLFEYIEDAPTLSLIHIFVLHWVKFMTL